MREMQEGASLVLLSATRAPKAQAQTQCILKFVLYLAKQRQRLNMIHFQLLKLYYVRELVSFT
jgi:hypothetical protein